MLCFLINFAIITLKKIFTDDFFSKVILIIIGAMLVPLLKHLFKLLSRAIKILIIKLNRNKKFQHDYLKWAIQTNKFISILPSTLAGVKTSTLHLIKLEEIYISLSICKGNIEKNLSLSEILKNYNRIIILGEPGAGKSTMMQYLTLQIASNFIPQQRRKKNEFEKKFPILIRLNKFFDITNWPKEKTLLSAIKREIESNISKSIPENFLETQLKENRCLILFDAFDELASVHSRQILAEKVKNLVARYPGNQFIVTSRITGYSNQLAGAGFDNPYTIRRLSSNHIQNFVQKWYEHIATIQTKEEDENERLYLSKYYAKRAQSLIEIIENNERIRQLSINPMLLSLITLVHYVKVKLPDQRHLLYRECIEILIDQWDAIKDIHSPILERMSINEKIRVIQRIAWYMQKNYLKSITKNDLLEKILKKTCSEIVGEKITDNEFELFLKAIEERTGLLVEKGFNEQGQPEISFSHMTFQEYLSTLELLSLNKNENKTFKILMNKIEHGSDWWIEVGLLTISQFTNPQAYQKKLYRRIFLDKENAI